MANVYSEGSYGIGNYSAATNWDAEGSVSVSSSVANDPSAAWGGIGTIIAVTSVFADPNHIFGGVASLVPVMGYEADAVVVIERRGEAHLVVPVSFSARANAEFNSTASVSVLLSFGLDPFGGPYWDPEIADGSWSLDPTESEDWVPDVPSPGVWVITPVPSGIWTPETITAPSWS